MNKILKWSLIGIGSLISLVVSLILFIWLVPETIINTKTVKWAAGKQTAIQFEPGFPEDFDISVKNSKFFGQKLSIKASNFCMHTEDKSIDACFNELSANVAFNFKKLRLMLDSLGPIKVDIKSLVYKAAKKAESKNKEEEKKNAPPTALPDLAEDFKLNEVTIHMPDAQFKSEKFNAQLGLTLDALQKSSDRYEVALEAKMTSDKDPKDASIKLNSVIAQNTEVKGDMKLHVGTGKKKPQVDVDTTFNGNIIKQRGELIGNAKVEHLATMVPLLEIKRFKITKTEKLVAQGDFNIDLLIGSLNNPKKSALPPPEFKTRFSGKIEAEQSKNKPVKFDLSINPLEQYGLVAMAKAKGEYDTKNAELNLENFLVSLKIENFRKTVAGLKNTQMAIPAPINELAGSISFEIGKDNVEKTGDHFINLPIILETNLTSKTQSLVIDTKGGLNLSTKTFKGKLKMDIELNDIAIQAPDLDPISKVPTVVGDKRFIREKQRQRGSVLFAENKKSDKPSPISLEINVTTPKKPIRLLYEHFKPAAILRFESKIRDDISTFHVKFEPFDVNFLKRTARLQHLNISDDRKTDGLLLDGRFTIKKLDYNIYVDIHEEDKATTIELSSEPPLSQDDIVSLLLFNELASTLDTSASGSVADTQAAMTKRTIGFLSFFLLASTPIESVNYDSSTGQYSARIKLPGGFTGTVGSDWDKSQEVGLRRRLGGRWVISAAAGTDAEGKSVQESMIEWFYRY